MFIWCTMWEQTVALRKESVDRNITRGQLPTPEPVALRKESVDRNIMYLLTASGFFIVALRKESVDRNMRTTLIFLLSP